MNKTKKTDKKIVVPKEPVVETPPQKIPDPMRKIIIETDGNNINLVKAEVSGKIELIAILQGLIAFLNSQSK